MITTKTDFAKIRLVEIPNELKKRNREFVEGRTPTTGYRLVVSFSDTELSETEKDLLAQAPESVRHLLEKQIKANRTEIRYSGVFNAEDILETKDGQPFTTPKDGYTDDQQDAICQKIIDTFAACGNTNIFTIVTITIDELLEDTEYKGTKYLLYENADGMQTKIDNQSRLFFGFFADKEAAKNMIRRSLLARIENGNLELPEPKAAETKPAQNPLENL